MIFVRYRKTCGYHIEKDNETLSKIEFEQSISSQLESDLVENDNSDCKISELEFEQSISSQLESDLVENDNSDSKISELEFERSISSLDRELDLFSGSDTDQVEIVNHHGNSMLYNVIIV